ncbi:MAG: thioredoxin family protein [Caldilineaceae bacterium]|nr:thioredoxin family protein [Caldilineaceae bacterium]
MSTVISVQQPVFAFTSGETFEEYCQAQPTELADLLRRVFAGVRIEPDTQLYLATYPNWLTCVVIVEDQTPDTTMILPILVRIVETCPRMDLRILSTDMDLTAINEVVDEEIDLEDELNEVDLPLLLFFDEEWNQQAQWGPRPAAVEKRLDEWMAAHPAYEAFVNDDESEDSPLFDQLANELTHQMRFWYNDGLTAACVAEIRTLLENLESN